MIQFQVLHVKFAGCGYAANHTLYYIEFSTIKSFVEAKSSLFVLRRLWYQMILCYFIICALSMWISSGSSVDLHPKHNHKIHKIFVIPPPLNMAEAENVPTDQVPSF